MSNMLFRSGWIQALWSKGKESLSVGNTHVSWNSREGPSFTSFEHPSDLLPILVTLTQTVIGLSSNWSVLSLATDRHPDLGTSMGLRRLRLA